MCYSEFGLPTTSAKNIYLIIKSIEEEEGEAGRTTPSSDRHFVR
jgi:hypothetical protein